jgi:hypothetical protein
VGVSPVLRRVTDRYSGVGVDASAGVGTPRSRGHNARPTSDRYSLESVRGFTRRGLEPHCSRATGREPYAWPARRRGGRYPRTRRRRALPLELVNAVRRSAVGSADVRHRVGRELPACPPRRAGGPRGDAPRRLAIGGTRRHHGTDGVGLRAKIARLLATARPRGPSDGTFRNRPLPDSASSSTRVTEPPPSRFSASYTP